jgi:hypothetical protein
LSASDYLEGAFFFVVMLGATGAAAHFGLRWRADLRGAARVVAFAVLWMAGIVSVHIVVGALGILGRVEVAVAAVVLLAVVFAVARARTPAAVAEGAADLYPPAPDSGVRSSVFAVAAIGGVALVILAIVLRDAQSAPWHVDLISFHLPDVARWIQSKSLWHINDFIPDRSPGNYPETGDVFSLSVILPWRDDFLIRLVNMPLLAVTGLSCYALGRELRAPAATAAIAAAGVVALPVVSWVAFASLADTAMLATFGPGVYFLVRAARTPGRADLVFAGIALGLSLGTRWYAVYAVAAVLGVWALAWLVARRPVREVAAGFGLLSGLVLLFGGFWLLRNWVESSNPFYPVKVAPFGITIFDAPPDLYRAKDGFSLAHYATDFHVWSKYLWPTFLTAMGWISVALWAGLAGGAVVAFARLRKRVADGGNSAVILALVAAAAVIGLAYIVTPYTGVGPPGQPKFAYVNSRYVIPALVLGTGVLAWLLARLGPWRQLFELVIVAAILDALRRLIDLPGPGIDAKGLALAIAGVAVVLVLVAGVRLLARPGRQIAFAGAGIVVVLVAVAAGRHQQDNFDAARYLNTNPVIQYINDKAPVDKKVGIVGEGWGNYPLFGPHLRNRVEYIGQRRQGTMRPYRTKAGFDKAINDGHFNLVVVQEISSLDPKIPLVEEGWLAKHGYTLVAQASVFSYAAPQRLYVAPGTPL